MMPATVAIRVLAKQVVSGLTVANRPTFERLADVASAAHLTLDPGGDLFC